MKILHLYTALDDGGVERFLLNYYKEMNRSQYKFDIVVPGQHVGILEKQFIELGCNVFHVCKFSDNPIKNIAETARVVKKGNYDVVHCHGYKSVEGLILGKLFGINNRIVHSHMVIPNETSGIKFKRKFIVLICKLFATSWWACGIDAGKWLFGAKAFKQGKVTVVPNAIQLDTYKFDETAEKKLRAQFQISPGVKILGNVARLSLQKNQEFLLESFAKIPMGKDYILLLVGSGELRQKLELKSKQLEIFDRVRFLGSRNDVPNLLSLFDLFILPSKFEGLPVSLVEAQASGLKCLVSDTVTTEVNVTGNIKYVSLKSGQDKWAKEIIKLADEVNNRDLSVKKMKNGMFDIITQSNNLQNLYLEIYSKGRS